MEILNSGSFVPLDNREKIEQLIFTAKTLATELSRTEGFQGSGPTNHQLGLEMWKGAEYMCRAHEEATIRNLFLSKFLERLREIERQTAVQPSTPQTPAVNPTTTHPPVSVQAQVAPISAHTVPISVVSSQDILPPPQSQKVRDEYLGVVSETPPTESDRPSYAAECVPEWEAAGVEKDSDSETDEMVGMAVGESKEDEPQESIPSDFPQAEESAAIEADPVDVPESEAMEQPLGEDVSSKSTTPSCGTGVASIVLSEKEPYNFESCTVTAVIQLLPENGGTRKCVFSLRSHDFAPQITISDLPCAEINEGVSQCLETAFGLYRTNLPALAAEKIKKQKPASKKRSSKADEKGTNASSGSDEKTSVGSNVPPAALSSEAAKNQQNLFAS
jgi:hypothetical protein